MNIKIQQYCGIADMRIFLKYNLGSMVLHATVGMLYSNNVCRLELVGQKQENCMHYRLFT
jgi:hypothetical protein